MNRYLTVAFIIGCALLICVSSLSADDNKSLRADNWDLDLSLDAPNVIPPAVQVAIFNTDPVQFFRYRIIHDREIYRKSLESYDDKALLHRIQATGIWDGVFDNVKGSKISLLYSAPGHTFTITSNDGGGHKWIVTKTRDTKSGPYCWRLPVNLIPGHETKVVLTENNTFYLDSLYNELMK